jgi:hypothetical protein
MTGPRCRHIIMNCVACGKEGIEGSLCSCHFSEANMQSLNVVISELDRDNQSITNSEITAISNESNVHGKITEVDNKKRNLTGKGFIIKCMSNTQAVYEYVLKCFSDRALDPFPGLYIVQFDRLDRYFQYKEFMLGLRAGSHCVYVSRLELEYHANIAEVTLPSGYLLWGQKCCGKRCGKTSPDWFCTTCLLNNSRVVCCNNGGTCAFDHVSLMFSGNDYVNELLCEEQVSSCSDGDSSRKSAKTSV